MKKILPYILIIIFFVGLFGLVSTKQVHADACVMTGWSYSSCYGGGTQQNPGTSGSVGAVYTGTSSGNQNANQPGELCVLPNTSVSNCKGGKFYKSPDNPPAATEGVSVTVQQPAVPPGTEVQGTCKLSSNGDTFTTTDKLCHDSLGNREFWTPLSDQTAALNAVNGVCMLNGQSTGASFSDCKPPAVWNNTTTSPEGVNKTAFQKYLNDNQCGFLKDNASIWPGCALQVSYGLFDQLPAFILVIAAYFFNFLISATLSSSMFSATFVSNAWGVVRDLSNIFFILILLYVAIQLILDIHGVDAKKTIARVVLVALLINFSMFFTSIVIDSSNILALIFYNKMGVNTVDANNKPVEYQAVVAERDVSGAMVASFDPTRLLSQDFFDHAGTIKVMGQDTQNTVPASMVIGIMVLAGTIMLFAAYAFFVTGLYFLGRMIELFVLIIFSPFAFMSFTVPFLSSIEDIGWSSWSKRLVASSFMAPIFMFFMYFIFLLIKAKPFDSLISQTSSTMIVRILSVVIPSILILVLLLKATKYAKKGSGAFGEAVISGAKMVGGLAIGGAALGTAVVGRNVAGRALAGASRDPNAVHLANARVSHNKSLAEWERSDKKGDKPLTWEAHKKDYENKNTEGVAIKENAWTKLGAKVNESQMTAGDTDRARHEMDETMKAAGIAEGRNASNLTGAEQKTVENTYTKGKSSEIESDIKRGYNSKREPIEIEAENAEHKMVKVKGEPAFKEAIRTRVTNEIIDKPEAGDVEDKIVKKGTGKKDIDGNEIMIDTKDGVKLSKQGENKLQDRLNTAFNDILKTTAQNIGHSQFVKLQQNAQAKVGMGTRLMSGSASGTYDVRNLSTLKADKREGLGTKATVGLISAVALGMRMGLKKGAGVEVGAPQGNGNFLKDLGQTISESLKHVKLDVKVEGGHEKHSSPAAHVTSESVGGGNVAGAGGGGHGGGKH